MVHHFPRLDTPFALPSLSVLSLPSPPHFRMMLSTKTFRAPKAAAPARNMRAHGLVDSVKSSVNPRVEQLRDTQLSQGATSVSRAPPLRALLPRSFSVPGANFAMYRVLFNWAYISRRGLPSSALVFETRSCSCRALPCAPFSHVYATKAWKLPFILFHERICSVSVGTRLTSRPDSCVARCRAEC